MAVIGRTRTCSSPDTPCILPKPLTTYNAIIGPRIRSPIYKSTLGKRGCMLWIVRFLSSSFIFRLADISRAWADQRGEKLTATHRTTHRVSLPISPDHHATMAAVVGAILSLFSSSSNVFEYMRKFHTFDLPHLLPVTPHPVALLMHVLP